MGEKRLIVSLVAVVSVVIALTGCESFRRKFVRARKDGGVQETMVITPRDYSAHPFPNDVLYRQYFTYWKSWNQELVRSCEERASQKKVLDCVQQCLINLRKMKEYLIDEQAVQLDVYIQKTEYLRGQIEPKVNLLPSQYNIFRYDADRLLSRINRRFDGHKMKDAIKTTQSTTDKQTSY